VSDTGIGIAPADQARIFEEFTQVESRLQGQARGTGLGLPLSRRLAELLGGTLEVSSEVGRGTTFTLELPMRYGLVLADQDHAERNSEANRRRVLVIDDDEAARYVFRQLAPRTQWQVIEAANGNEGLQRAQADQPQVIVLDLRMPGLDGFAVLERLSDDPATQHIPVIVATASALSERERARLGRARLIIAKSDLTRDLVASSLLSLGGVAAGGQAA
jgi:CheY-like chemotaxis protein